MDQPGAVPSGQSSAMQLLVTPANGPDSVRYVGNVALRDGLQRGDIENFTFYDNGSTADDLIAGDNIYTHNNVYAFSNAELGPYTMRFNCEVYDANYQLHGTAVEVYPFTVVADIAHLGIGEFDPESGIGLYPNYPNPVGNNTTFSYHLIDRGTVRMSIINGLGQIVSELFEGKKNPGNWAVDWTVPSHLGNGIYLLKLEADGKAQAMPFVISR